MSAAMESLIALGCLLGLALICVLVSAGWAALKRRRNQEVPRRLLVHSINDDRCTGCDACVAVCPTDVLELVTNKSRVMRFDDCIQCEQCALVCPTTALVMHPAGTTPPAYRVPELDEYYQAAPGLYLIGEAAGKPLVKNASNLGRAVVEHMLASGLRPSRSHHDGEVDVFIVGSGPGGLSAALSCVQRGLSYALIEKDELVAATIARWPKGKECMAEPYDVRCVGLLPVWDSKKDDLLQRWRAILDDQKVRIKLRESVEEVARGLRGYEIKTDKGRYRAQRVVLAVGTRGKPRRLGVPGEHLAKVSPLLDDPMSHRGHRVMVVGGGDSAVEAAVALAETAARVTLSYRGKALSRCKARNRQLLGEAVSTGRIDLKFSSHVVEIKEHTIVLGVGMKQEEIGNDHIFVCIGGDAPVKWLESVGVRFVDKPHMFQRAKTDTLVEKLIGPQPLTGAAPDAVIVDLGSLSGVLVDEEDESQTVIRFPLERARRSA
jgi:thioredoxin reductase/NAD-dependent dihydropyrimidine dehydrogenase PreA subunit